VLHETAKLPYGVTSSYGEVAARAGNPRAYRAAGTALGRNPIPLVVPCHRVLQSGGGIGEYGGGPEMKEWLLRMEGAVG
jgi:methylated-DNA-[protein]-cysteine S-methyltransferase